MQKIRYLSKWRIRESELLAEPLEFALIVGVDHYPRYEPALKSAGAAKNALAIHEWFNKRAKELGVETFCRLLRSTGDERDEAKSQNIRDALNKMVEACPPTGARLLVYFSGHGGMKGSRGIMLPSDANERSEGIFLDDLVRWFGRTPFEQQVFVFEVCREVLPKDQGCSDLETHKEFLLERPHQALIVNATLAGALAFGEKNDDVPGFLTDTFLRAMEGQLTKALIHGREHESLCVQEERLSKGLEDEFRRRNLRQIPTLEPKNSRSFRPPLCLVHPSIEIDVSERDWFLDGEWPDFVGSLLRDLLAPVAAEWEEARRNGKRCLLLPGIPGTAAAWAVRALYGDANVETVATKGRVPNLATIVDVASERLGETFASPSQLVAALRAQTSRELGTVLAVVLPLLGREDLVREVLEKLVTELRPDDPVAVILVDEDPAAADTLLRIVSASSVADTCILLEPLAPNPSAAVAAWLARRRHDLPRPIVTEREVQSAELGQADLERTVAKICDVLNVAKLPWAS